MEITQAIIDRVWEKGEVVPGYNKDLYRKDACGAWIRKSQYGDRTTAFGWEIDHIFPKIKLDSLKVPQEEINDIRNLRPLHWLNNSAKGGDYPEYHAKITSDGNHNKLLEENSVYAVAEGLQVVLLSLYGKYIGK